MSRPRVTVCICTFNRARLLDATLAEFSRLDVPADLEWELLVVDNNSTDDTPAVLERHRGQLPMRPLHERAQGLAHARNRGINEARYDWILFTDDDVQIGEDWLNTFAAAIERHPEAVVAGGPIDPWFPEPPDPLLVDVFPELRHGFCGLDYGLPEGVLDRGQDVFGANFAIRLDQLRTRRFDPNLGVPHRLNEETELINQIRREGGAVLWIPAMRVRHYVDPPRMTLDYLRRYRALQGATQVNIEGLPPSPRLFGAPRWLWRKYLEAYARSFRSRLAGRRRDMLVHMREYTFYEGMIRAAREDRP